MNLVKLSGRLEDIAEQYDREANRFLTAVLHFQGGSITVISAGENAKRLDPYDTGDIVKVEGRLATSHDSFAVLVDTCDKYITSSTLPRATLQANREINAARIADETRQRWGKRRAWR